MALESFRIRNVLCFLSLISMITPISLFNVLKLKRKERKKCESSPFIFDKVMTGSQGVQATSVPAVLVIQYMHRLAHLT